MPKPVHPSTLQGSSAGQQAHCRQIRQALNLIRAASLAVPGRPSSDRQYIVRVAHSRARSCSPWPGSLGNNRRSDPVSTERYFCFSLFCADHEPLAMLPGARVLPAGLCPQYGQNGRAGASETESRVFPTSIFGSCQVLAVVFTCGAQSRLPGSRMESVHFPWHRKPFCPSSPRARVPTPARARLFGLFFAWFGGVPPSL